MIKTDKPTFSQNCFRMQFYDSILLSNVLTIPTNESLLLLQRPNFPKLFFL